MRVTNQLRGASSRGNLANSLLSIEYFPYHSVSFAHSHVRLPSQQFSFDLVRKAIARDSEIIVARGFDSWVGAVPELAAYSRVCKLNSAQKSAMSANNLGPENFSRIVHTLSLAGVALSM